ncbi:3-deoxy-manno-octulosonate cytidylyltransferase [Neptunomonas antarctica]|uniref:3-deoxy-manno-octulosonate cytidylyltransferase (CMP-KDO synthetase) n=1 Tax=Neptunomonas antarctica TaxID=619304 RepID=A0A1N7JDB7_9GAMM|nr:3-deoxy-manno-octulosonate cytidylyltransferase [Neptunomonas antarctica]SIS47264.1 3-deoxy-manno-octulosonate cytidylyltransferase (CMP-KDO synthetase) [Neptunomonas antarctica]
MSSCVIIPARYASSRFPGKPLAKIHGRPMILWVAELSAEAVGREHVYVATESELIAEVVISAGFNAIMTDPEALTGTDRVAEAAQKLDYDVFINVQGDEPIVRPEDIRRCIQIKLDHPYDIVCGYCWMNDKEDPTSVNVPKVVVNEADMMVYMSRLPVPGHKTKQSAPGKYAKQVCIYGFSRSDLAQYRAFGRKSYLESCEDIEILRYLELNLSIRMFETPSGSLAVDIPEDISAVEEAIFLR